MHPHPHDSSRQDIESPTTADATQIFDVNVLIAMVAYLLLGWLVIWLIRLFQGAEPGARE